MQAEFDWIRIYGTNVIISKFIYVFNNYISLA